MKIMKNLMENYEKEEKNRMTTIHTRKFGMYGQEIYGQGQLERLAQKGDTEEFVYRRGEIVPVSSVKDTGEPTVHSAPEPNFS